MAVITGMWGIDDCVGEGACTANGCSTHGTCSDNDYYGSYAHYTECSGHVCPKQTGLTPLSSTGCGQRAGATSTCIVGPFYAWLWECGPVA